MTAIQNGEADWMFDEPPPTDRLAEMGTKNKDQVHVTPLTAWWYVPMNTSLAPFDNVKARQAVDYAIDRKALVNIFGGPVLAAPFARSCLRASLGMSPIAPTPRIPARNGRRRTWRRPSNSSRNRAPRARR